MLGHWRRTWSARFGTECKRVYIFNIVLNKLALTPFLWRFYPKKVISISKDVLFYFWIFYDILNQFAKIMWWKYMYLPLLIKTLKCSCWIQNTYHKLLFLGNTHLLSSKRWLSIRAFQRILNQNLKRYMNTLRIVHCSYPGPFLDFFFKALLL